MSNPTELPSNFTNYAIYSKLKKPLYDGAPAPTWARVTSKKTLEDARDYVRGEKSRSPRDRSLGGMIDPGPGYEWAIFECQLSECLLEGK